MAIDIDPAWIATVFFLAIRLGVVLIVSPIFSGLAGFVSIRVFFTLALSLVLVSGLITKYSPMPLDFASLIGASLSELVVGSTMAFGIFAAFGAFSVAGKILDIQSGFGIGSVFDPVTRAGAPLFSTMLNMLAVAVFFGMDGHHALIKGFAFSAQQITPGSGFSELSAEVVIRQFGSMFSLGVALIAPVMFCLFLVEAGLAVVSRVLPQMNVFVVGVPIKIVAGVSMFALTVGSIGPVMGRVYGSIFSFWEQVLR